MQSLAQNPESSKQLEHCFHQPDNDEYHCNNKRYVDQSAEAKDELSQ
jgi:hypothetical protein